MNYCEQLTWEIEKIDMRLRGFDWVEHRFGELTKDQQEELERIYSLLERYSELLAQYDC